MENSYLRCLKSIDCSCNSSASSSTYLYRYCTGEGQQGYSTTRAAAVLFRDKSIRLVQGSLDSELLLQNVFGRFCDSSSAGLRYPHYRMNTGPVQVPVQEVARFMILKASPLLVNAGKNSVFQA